MAIIKTLKDKAASHKTLASIVGILLICALCVGGYFGWQQYQYMQTSKYAIEKIKKALAPPDPEALAKMMDFNAITRDLALGSQKAFPFYMSGPHQEINVQRRLQKALKGKLTEKETKGSQFPEDQDEIARLQKPVAILPGDFASQILDSLSVRDTSPDTAIATAKFTNQQLRHEFQLDFAMKKTGDGWKITGLANAEELTSQLRTALLNRHAALRNVFLNKNKDTATRMTQTLPLEECTANAGLLSDGKTMIMIIHVKAKNTGQAQINNFNLDTAIMGRSGNMLLRRYLNTAKPVPAGSEFDHRWSVEMSAQDPAAVALVQDSPLQCRAAWQALGLGTGEVLHIVEVPNPDTACTIPGHNHPDGFCLTPLFVN